jgi:Phosphotransferase enzyme family
VLSNSSPAKIGAGAAVAARSLVELLQEASSRGRWFPEDTKSGARFERLVIDGERYVLKYQDARDDWLMRATGDTGQRYARLWEQGVLAALPDVIDHAVVACDVEDGVGRVLLRDVSAQLLVPDGALTAAQHERFLDHMAQLHAAFWGWRDDIGLTPMVRRYLMFSPEVARWESAIGSPALVPQFMAAGWARLPQQSRAMSAVVFPLLRNPEPLLSALASVPHTLVHGDWKAANIGSHADGRTVLLDFGEVPGEATPIADLAWYLALNAALLPESKDDTIERYRGALERHGVDTAPWWDRALALELLGTMVQFGWEKSLGGPGPELGWWEARAVEGARRL